MNLSNARKKIEIVLSELSQKDKIALLESISKKYRRANSKRLNKEQMNYRITIEERPDELLMKN